MSLINPITPTVICLHQTYKLQTSNPYGNPYGAKKRVL